MNTRITGLLVSTLFVSICGDSAVAQQTPATWAVASHTTTQEKTPATTPATKLTNESSVDEILDALDVVGKTLTSLEADVSKSDIDAAAGDSITRAGVVLLGMSKAGDAKLRVTFNSVQRNEDAPRTGDAVKQDYLLVDGWLNDSNFDIRKVVRYQVRPPGESVNLLGVGEGPFPLPIGQSKEAVHLQFDVKKLPSPSDRANAIVLDLRPKDGTKLRKRFARIIVDVDAISCMPVRIETMDRDIDDPTDPPSLINVTTLTNIKLNLPLAADAFAAGPTEGWDIETKPLDE